MNVSDLTQEVDKGILHNALLQQKQNGTCSELMTLEVRLQLMQALLFSLNNDITYLFLSVTYFLWCALCPI